MMQMVERAGLQVAAELAAFIEREALPGTRLEPDAFWSGTAALLAEFAPRNRALLDKRDAMQREIDSWHMERAGRAFDGAEYEGFLREIGYLVPEPPPFRIATRQVDPELATMAGPQLVVPVLNARFLLNAANARWGSLYDALYGTDALPGHAKPGGYDAERGAQVIGWAKRFLDSHVPLKHGSWHDWVGPELELRHPRQFAGRGPGGLLLKHNGLHIEIVIDSAHPIGRTDPGGISDIILEAALTTIVDLEDSIAAVDAADKVAAYRNWLGLMRGDLEAQFEKGGRMLTRRLAPDREWQDGRGNPFTVAGRSLLFVRNVGHLMTTPAMLLPDPGSESGAGFSEAGEGIIDGIITSLIGMHDVRGLGKYRNSATGSIYIVKPKMHGPEEAAFTNDLFDAIEKLLVLQRHTIKVGVMDEERRTSANLAASIYAVKDRIVFINTGFLDRTGDEMHSSMRAGPMIRKGDMKSSSWIKAYEDRNVQIGLACGLSGHAQIGKGMWAAPDRMADMLAQKIAHPMSGANTAWVPSPTAAVLHATHYHAVDVFARQAERAKEPVAPLEALLTIPASPGTNWSEQEIADELANNAQGILGYVVRWVDQGIGCSKVPDINDIGLMEDRATLRISSQHIANWLLHGVCTAEQVEAAFAAMAVKVDAQNAGDPAYVPMAGHAGDLAFAAARALVFEGLDQPNGYTEPLLHAYRARVKAGG